MKIDHATWNEIIAKAEASIARWNERATGEARPDIFTAKVEKGEKYVILITEHKTGYRTERKAVAREIATGELHKAQVVKRARLQDHE